MSGINRRLFDQGLQQIYGLGGGGVSSFITSKQVVSTDTGFAATTRNIAITSVDTANVIMFVGLGTSAGGNGADRDNCNFELTSSTNLRLTKDSASGGSSDYEVQIYEIDPALIQSNEFFSSSDGAFSGADFEDITIGAVDMSKTLLLHHGYATNNSNVSRNPWSVELTSATNARLAVFNGTSITIKGQAIEFK